MGINFPDIRYVINWGPARTLLDHHYEAGRAGRDNNQSHVIIGVKTMLKTLRKQKAAIGLQATSHLIQLYKTKGHRTQLLFKLCNFL